MSGNLTITRADGSLESSRDDTFEAVTDLATKDATVSRALRLFGSDVHDWVNLYRIYEIIESDMGGLIAMINLGWTSKLRVSNFKHTANSVSAAGDEARRRTYNSSAVSHAFS